MREEGTFTNGNARHFYKGNVCLAFRQKKGVHLGSAAFLFPSAQKNLYAQEAYLGGTYSDPLYWWLYLYLQGNRVHFFLCRGNRTTGHKHQSETLRNSGHRGRLMSHYYSSLHLFSSGCEILNVDSFFTSPPSVALEGKGSCGLWGTFDEGPPFSGLPGTPPWPWLASCFWVSRNLSPLLRWGRVASSSMDSGSLGYARSSLPYSGGTSILKPCTFDAFSRKGIRIWYLKLCHIGLRIILKGR